MPTKSMYPDIDIPPMDIWTFLFERKTEFPDYKTIYTDPIAQKSYTYSDVKTSTISFGKGLKAAWNWKKDEVLLLYMSNSINTPIVTWGTHWAGGVISPANPGCTPKELAFQLKDCGATTIATQYTLLKKVRVAAEMAGIAEDRIILIDEEDKTKRSRHFTDICRLGVSHGSIYQRTITANPKRDLAFLVYSSGTTGHPKGVMLSHENIISNVLMLKAGEGVNLSWQGRYDNKGDRLLGFLPFYHIYGE